MKRQQRITFPKEDDKSECIKKLKGMVRNLQKENKRMKTELKTLEAAFVETQGFLKKQMWDFSVEEVIDAVKKHRRLNAAKGDEVVCEKCGATMDHLDVPAIGTIYICTNCTHRYTVRRHE